MTQQNQNPQTPPPAGPTTDTYEEGGTEDGTITLSLSEYNRALAAARRTGQRRAERAPAPSAPASSGGSDRLDRLEGMIEKLVGHVAGPAPAPAAPAAPAPLNPPAAPSAPTPHALPTSGGMTNLWAMSVGQLEQMGPQGVARELQALWDVGHRSQGAPPRPEPPGGVQQLTREVRELARRIPK